MVDKKRNKARMKLLKSGIQVLPDDILTNFHPEQHALVISNGGQKCQISTEFLKNNVLNCQPKTINILQPRNQTFALAKLVDTDECKMDLKEFQTRITFDEVPDAKHFQDKLYLAPIMFRFIVPSLEFEKFEQNSLLPPGLKIVKNYITEEEEKEFVDLLNDVRPSDELRNRNVYHFGHDFNYDVNASTKNLENTLPIPEIAKMKGYDQLTCNVYHPTEGKINAHIDNTEAFGPEIAVISCNSDTVMEFKHSEDETDAYSVHIPRRSLYTMSGDSRYRVVLQKCHVNGQQLSFGQFSVSCYS